MQSTRFLMLNYRWWYVEHIYRIPIKTWLLSEVKKNGWFWMVYCWQLFCVSLQWLLLLIGSRQISIAPEELSIVLASPYLRHWCPGMLAEPLWHQEQKWAKLWACWNSWPQVSTIPPPWIGFVTARGAVNKNAVELMDRSNCSYEPSPLLVPELFQGPKCQIIWII